MKLFFVLSCLLVPSFASATTQNSAPPERGQDGRATSVKEWTLLVYINGNNNLDTYGAMDINEMETVGSTDKVNVVVQWASMAATSTKRLLVVKDNDPNTVTSPTLEDVGNVDMGDYHSLVDFIRWGVTNFPAKHYFVDVWNHGSGWHMKNLSLLSNPMKATDISWDDKSHNYMKTEQLGQAMAEAAQIIGHKVDIYGSDACLMGMAEVADEMADSVETYVGSEEVEPLKGWPYDALLSGWNALGDNMTGAEIGKILTREYVKSYSNGSQGTENGTFSAYDMSKLPAFNEAVKNFGTKVRQLDKASRDKLVASADTAQKFSYSDYVDVLDFLTNVQAKNIAGLAGDETAALRAAAKNLVIASAATDSYAKAQGLAIWLPTSSYSYDSYSARYKGLHFQAHTGWGDTLQALLAP
ncbi:MAG: hypothetical protein HY074_09240 [Deltaproteobacteria bacterium]|nr:hypothetical protein [Deltaproteobacteria bacterium]